ncbi:hypothetical protein ES703_99972 [subsurface metagenome]
MEHPTHDRRTQTLVKIQFGDIITEMRGSIGGVTYSNNAAGDYRKLKRGPGRVRSIYQSPIREIFGYLTHYWTDDLSAPQRTAWDTYAAGTTFYDSLGETYHASGFNMFLRTNTLLVRIGETIIETAPATGGHGTTLTIDKGQIYPNETLNRIDFLEEAFTNWDKTVTSDIIIISFAPQIPPTLTTKRLPPRIVRSVVGDVGSPPGFPLLITYPFGYLKAGNLAIMKFRRVEPDGKVASFAIVIDSIAA